MKQKLILYFIIFIVVINISPQNDTMFVFKIDNSVLKYSINNLKLICFDRKYLATDIPDANTSTYLINDFVINQNYPNPFNPNTTLEYYLPKPGNVDIKIFNINGELIKGLVNTFHNEGDYKIVWDGKNDYSQSMPSGVYFYQVKFNSKIFSNKMILIK